MEFINKKEFVKEVLDKRFITFVIYIVALKAPIIGVIIYLSLVALITSNELVKIATLYQDEIPTKISPKYINYTNIFLYNLTMELQKNKKINKYVIKLKKGKQLSYGLINSIKLIELEILKIYIKTYLTTGFIWSFKFSASALILFNKKFDSNFYLCVNYQNLNNLIIKNWYSFLLIKILLN